jgi:membrane protein YqaA with SNARE-associated domain
MRTVVRWVIGTFASPIGIVVLGALDSTIFFSMPFGIDAAVVVMAARSERLAWMVPCLATIGSIAGAALTFWMGKKAGDAGLERFVPRQRLERVQRRIKNGGAVALALLTLIPPPFPFTPFILVAGALNVRAPVFFVALAASRLLRFGVEAALAVRYGRRILTWMESDLFQGLVFASLALAIVLTTVTIVRLARPARAKSFV